MTDLGPHTVTFTAPAPPDEFGDPTTGTLATDTVTGCMVYPVGSDEGVAPRDTTVVTGLVALLPRVPTTIGPRHTVTVVGRDGTYTVDGDYGRWDHFDGTLGAVQVALRKATD